VDDKEELPRPTMVDEWMGDSDLGGDGCCGLQGGREGGRGMGDWGRQLLLEREF
jgi:hypothetical protein